MKPTLRFVTVWIAAMAMARGRSWMHTHGKVIDAQMVSADATTVFLEPKDGSVVQVPIVSLSPVDQAFE